MPKSTDLKEERFRATAVISKRIRVTFAPEDSELQQVLLCGDFNDRSPVRPRITQHNQHGQQENAPHGRGSLQIRTNPPPARIRFITLTPAGVRRAPAARLHSWGQPQAPGGKAKRYAEHPDGDPVQAQAFSGT